MSIKKSQEILKCFIDLKNSSWFTMGSENETMFCDTSEKTFFSSTAGPGGGYSHTLPIRASAAQRDRDFEAPDLERCIHFRGVL